MLTRRDPATRKCKWVGVCRWLKRAFCFAPSGANLLCASQGGFTMNRFRATIAGLAIGITVAISDPVVGQNVLRWASVGGALTFDPHAVAEVPSWAQHNQVYEQLLNIDSDLRIAPELATAWRLVDPLTWKFELRQGVSFHDGTPFTAEDVVFNFERVRAGTSEWGDWVQSIEAVEAADRHTVLITTKTANPLLPMEVSQIWILSKAWAERHDAVMPASFRDGEVNYATNHANGTGPFVLSKFEPGGRIVMTRNPNWWGFERYPHNIDRIEYTPITGTQERLGALLDGTIDLLTDPPLRALEQIEGTSGLKLEKATELRTIFLSLDQASDALRSSDVTGSNPFKDSRVRRAIYQAIDIESIHEQVMNGLSVPAGMIIQPGINGYEAALDERLPYDREDAKSLLAEAGYPDGFSVTLDCPNNRYINDEAVCNAIASQLGWIGIDVDVNAQPKDRHFRKVKNGRSDFFLSSWASVPLDSQTIFRRFYHSRGAGNTGYLDPQVDELIENIETETVTYVRDALIEEVWRIVLDDVVYIPLHHQVVVWAMHDSLELPVDPFDVPRFREARLQ